MTLRTKSTGAGRGKSGAAAAALSLVLAALALLVAAPRSAAKGGSDLLADLSAEPYAPHVRVLDTEASFGPLAATARTVTLEDLVRFHGHPCDGLVVASAAMAHGLGVLFPDGVVDRTDVTAAVNASPCYGDAAAYLTGARARYHTLIIDKRLGDTWILHRRSTGRTVAVRLKAGVKPTELPGLEKKLRSGGCDVPLMRRVQTLQSAYAKAVLASPPDRVFDLAPLSSFPYEVGPIRADASKAHCRR